jgi:hypothetical protein
MTDLARHVMIEEIPTEYIPFEVGSIRIGKDGKVDVKPGEQVSRFGFNFEGIRFSALASRQQDCGHLRLCGSLGVLPYTAESARTRQAMLTAVHDTAAIERGRFVVSDNQNILFVGDVAVPLPFTPTRLLSYLTLCLLELKPHIHRLHAADTRIRHTRAATAAEPAAGRA